MDKQKIEELEKRITRLEEEHQYQLEDYTGVLHVNRPSGEPVS